MAHLGITASSSIEFTPDGTAAIVRSSSGRSSPPGPWSVSQWPPPEWGVQDTTIPQPAYSVYQPSRHRHPPSLSSAHHSPPTSPSGSHHQHHRHDPNAHVGHYHPQYIQPNQDFTAPSSFGGPAMMMMPGPQPTLHASINSPSRSSFSPSPPPPLSTRPHASPRPPPVPPRKFSQWDQTLPCLIIACLTFLPQVRHTLHTLLLTVLPKFQSVQQILSRVCQIVVLILLINWWKRWKLACKRYQRVGHLDLLPDENMNMLTTFLVQLAPNCITNS